MIMQPATFRVGSAEVIRIDEIVLGQFTPQSFFPDWGDGSLAGGGGLTEAFASDGGHLLLGVHSWLVRDKGRVVLIDTGAGNGKDRPYARHFDHLDTPFLDRLMAAGVSPAEVDTVLMTHLHVDHAGWNTRFENGAWIPTFPNARYIFSRKEHAFFTDPANLTERNRTSFQVQRDSIDPVVAAGLAEKIAVEGQEVLPGFFFHPTPGHTIDHASIEFVSEGETALFAGDIVHHPLQVAHPDLFSIYDPERERTLRSRLWALGFAADHDSLFFSSHFPAPSAGRVSREGSGFGWRFE